MSTPDIETYLEIGNHTYMYFRNKGYDTKTLVNSREDTDIRSVDFKEPRGAWNADRSVLFTVLTCSTYHVLTVVHKPSVATRTTFVVERVTFCQINRFTNSGL